MFHRVVSGKPAFQLDPRCLRVCTPRPHIRPNEMRRTISLLTPAKNRASRHFCRPKTPVFLILEFQHVPTHPIFFPHVFTSPKVSGICHPPGLPRPRDDRDQFRRGPGVVGLPRRLRAAHCAYLSAAAGAELRRDLVPGLRMLGEHGIPSGYVNIAIENSHRNRGFTH